MQNALDALLNAYTEEEWQQSFSSLSQQVAGVGPSHRAHLVALKYLPAHNPRGFALQQAATAFMLQGLCKIPTKVCMPRLLFMSCMVSSLPQVWSSAELCCAAILIRPVGATYDTAFGQGVCCLADGSYILFLVKITSNGRMVAWGDAMLMLSCIMVKRVISIGHIGVLKTDSELVTASFTFT